MDLTIIALAFVCLAILFYLLAIISLFRLYKAATSHIITRLGIAFYVALFITIITRAIAFTLIADDNISIGTKKYNEIFVTIMVAFPEMLNISVYLFLCWFYFSTFIESYVLSANDLKIFLNEGMKISKTLLRLSGKSILF
jgi:hypothetical protein